MNASELFKAGKLHDALAAQLQTVKADPGDRNKRLFLFELAAFTGDLDRARKQLDLLVYDTPELQQAVQLYHFALDSEQARRDTLRGKKMPEFYMDPPEHVQHRVAALAELKKGDTSAAVALLDQANAAMPSLKGITNNQPFDGIRDGDDLFGTMVEVFSQGRYFWAALEQASSLQIKAPETPRDLLWAPARLTLRDGPSGDVFLPTLYPFAHEQKDEALQLGRSTDWTDADKGPVRGVGGKMFLVGEEGVPILDLGELRFA